MSNIIVNNVKYRGFNFCQTPSMMDTTLSYGFFSLKDFQWFFVETSMEVTKYAFRHGAKVSGAYNGVREFTLTFDAIASDEIERMKLIRLISSIFNPPSIPNSTDGFHDLDFTTPGGTIRTVKVQTKTRPKISDYDNSSWISCTVELIAKDSSYIYSKDNKTIVDKTTLLGYKLPMTLGAKAKYYRDYIDYQGTSDSPVNIKIMPGTDIYNLTIKDGEGGISKIIDTESNIMKIRGDFYMAGNISQSFIYIRSFVGGVLNSTLELQNVDLEDLEYIFIDGFEELIYKISADGTKTDITNLVSLNSSRPLLLSPMNGTDQYFVVECTDGSANFRVEYSYYDIRD